MTLTASRVCPRVNFRSKHVPTSSQGRELVHVGVDIAVVKASQVLLVQYAPVLLGKVSPSERCIEDHALTRHRDQRAGDQWMRGDREASRLAVEIPLTLQE